MDKNTFLLQKSITIKEQTAYSHCNTKIIAQVSFTFTAFRIILFEKYMDLHIVIKYTKISLEATRVHKSQSFEICCNNLYAQGKK